MNKRALKDTVLFAVAILGMVALVMFIGDVKADTGFLVNEWTEGGMRYCEYDVMGETFIITIDYADMCDLTVEV